METEKPKTFEEVRQYLASFSCISGGGCGVAALAMYKWLDKQGEIEDDFKFVLCYRVRDEETYINNVGVLRNKNGKAQACDHIGIYYDGKYIDCRRSLDLTDYGTIQFISYDDTWFMQNALNNVGTWNTMFDRKQHIPEIEEALDISLKEIER